MSNYGSKALNPLTGKYEECMMLDDYYGKHRFGMRFSDGNIYPVAEFSKERDVYVQNGHKDRTDYLSNLAEEYDVDIDYVYEISFLLGPDEDFDGLVSALKDL